VRKQQSGVMLLEVLIAILIFSVGVLGIVGMQASALSASRDANYRADAALLANELAGQVFSGDRSSGAALQTAFQGSAGFVSAKDLDDPDRCRTDNPVTDGSMYCLWFNNRVLNALPGAATFPPQVVVVPGAVGTASEVRITVRWKAPNDLLNRQYIVTVSVI
jgi:type IV pilus assembly protein PilV